MAGMCWDVDLPLLGTVGWRELVVEHAELVLDSALLPDAALDGAAAAVEQVVLAAVTYLALQLQELLETIALRLVVVLVLFVLQPRGAGVCSPYEGAEWSRLHSHHSLITHFQQQQQATVFGQNALMNLGSDPTGGSELQHSAILTQNS
ncbi:hypothetical protein EYF80_027067 [Liparis tanakae]|uniref:Uncharacterized protein n=1 Tax=Liparis tanakae TaxID=230148 RepID=A0A4Z2HBS5_9TELE|nr:hypothetical protein EYF80_027067 [Liparis tanakae]